MHKERRLFRPHIIRAAKPTDIDAMQSLLLQLYREEGYDCVQDASTLSAALFLPSSPMRLRALVAECEEKIVGVLLYYSGYDTSSASFGIHLADIIVHKQLRRNGIGSELFSSMVTQCLSEGGMWISLTVLHKNVAARCFYQSLGFGKAKVDFYNMGVTKMMVHAPALMRLAVGIAN